jgi:hypothetical protein
MSYTVNVEPFDLSGLTAKSRMSGAIFAPPLSSPPPDSPAPLDTATPTAGDAVQLVFHSTAVPPSIACTMLIRDTTTSGDITTGDLFRSGPMLNLPNSPATLVLVLPKAVSMTARDVSFALNQRLPITVPFPADVVALCSLATGGVITPVSFTANDLTMQLGPTSTFAVNGQLNVKFLGFINQASGFSLTAQLAFAPSGDATNPARIVSVTSANQVASVDAFFLAPPAAAAIAVFGGGVIASALEDVVNGQIPALAAAAVPPNQMLTSTAVLSAGQIDIQSSNVTVVAVVGDILGGAVMPIPGNLLVEVNPAWQCDEQRNYVVTVRDHKDSSPVADALVTLQTGAGGPAGLGGPTVRGTTASDGTVQLNDVTLKSYVYTRGGGKGPPVVIKFEPVLTVSAANFNDFITQITCPAS